MSSIRRYLVTLLIAMLTLTSFLAALQSYRQSISRADLLFDQDLKMLAASLSAPFLPEHQPPVAADEPQLQLVVQLWHGDTLSYRSHHAPAQRIQAPTGYSAQNFSGQRWRTYQHVVPAVDATQPPLTVIVAQPLKQRQQLADEVVLASIYPVVLSIPFQALFIWLVVSKGLQPLRKFAVQLSGKKAADLSPVLLSEVPQELTQMLTTTNQLLSRLDDAFSREKRFASDVAHELRTPLTLLQVNLHNAQAQWQAQGVADPQGLMTALQSGVERMTQLIEQIMLLNRTNPEHFKAHLQWIDLTALSRDIVAELYPGLLQKQQQIELLAASEIQVKADSFAIRQLLLNLVGNAIKYTPDGGQIRVTLRRDHQAVCIDVEDSGPGIAPEEYARVFDRFYRIGGDRHQSGTPGSGLGLAIVREIVSLHHGKLQLAPAEFASGLKVTVELPC